MALPNIMRRLFRNDGYGPLLKPEIIPFTSDLASKAADVAASTKWLKDLVGVTVYVDASVSSSGDGFTAATAVKTIGEAVNLVKGLPGGFSTISIAAGTYTEVVQINDGLRVHIVLEGNVTIAGRLEVRYNSFAYITGNTVTLTIDNPGSWSSFHIRHNSTVVTEGINISIHQTNNTEMLFFIREQSIVVTDATAINVSLTYSGSSVTYFTAVDRASLLFAPYATLTASGGGLNAALAVVNGSTCQIGSVIADASAVTNNRHTIVVDRNSLLIAGGLNIKSGPSASRCVLVDANSQLLIDSHSEVYIRNNNSGGAAIFVVNQSYLNVAEGSSLTFDCSTQTARSIRISDGSIFGVEAASANPVTIKGLGKYTSQFLLVDRLSCANFSPYTNVVNSATGRRFQVSNCSIIVSGGHGQNFLPGNTAGTIDTNSFSIYS